MKKINLHNYEAFLLDYIEGTLDQELENELMEFLELHPEIELEEFDLDSITLQSPSIKLKDKEA